MKRVEEDGERTLMCSNEAHGLAEVWGGDFEELYERYEWVGVARRSRRRSFSYAILEAQVETGTPFMLYKDAANRE